MTKLSLLVFSYLEPILHVECEVGLQEKEERCWDYAAGDLKGGDGGLRDEFKRRKKSSRGWSVATEHPSSSTPVTCLRGGLMDGRRSGCNPSAWDSTRWEEEEGAISRIYQQSYSALHYTRNTCLFKKCNCDVILFFLVLINILIVLNPKMLSLLSQRKRQKMLALGKLTSFLAYFFFLMEVLKPKNNDQNSGQLIESWFQLHHPVGFWKIYI